LPVSVEVSQGTTERDFWRIQSTWGPKVFDALLNHNSRTF
jgi:hypothetical protein